MTTEQIIHDSSLEGNILRLPDIQLDRKAYVEVKKRLEGIGGKWKGGKVSGFVFPHDPSSLLEAIKGGKKVNLKKDYQFFPTPPELARHLVTLAQLSECCIWTDTVLEPSAGQGAIVDAIIEVDDLILVDVYEIMPSNIGVLSEKYKNSEINFIGEDFLEASQERKYSRIIANPPFTKNQDIDHVRKMYDVLAPGGRIVTVTSKHWQLSGNKKETEFRDWLNRLGATIEDVPAGTFKESGTMIESLIVVIDKKEASDG